MTVEIQSLLDELEAVVALDDIKQAPRLPFALVAPPEWKSTAEGQALLNSFSAIPEFEYLDNCMVIFGTGGRAADHTSWVGWIIARALRVGSKQALSEFAQFHQSETIPLMHFAMLADIHSDLDEEIVFHDGSRLGPASSILSRALISELSLLEFNGLPTPRVEMALTYDGTQKKQILKQEEKADWANEDQRFEDIALCLSLARPPNYGIQLWASSIFVPEHIPQVNFGFGWQIPYFRKPAMQPPMISFEGNLARKIYGQFDALEPSLKDQLRVPMRKLNDFGSQSPGVDQLIDLRVALESFFMTNNKGNNVQAKVSSRAARLLSDDQSERDQIKADFVDGYDWMSRAMHSGQIPTTIDWKIIDRVALGLRAAIRKNIEMGKAIEWAQIT